MVSFLQNCKLTYFGITGRGEATRLALTIGGIDFVDERIDFADWPSLKPTTPWGSLPVLTLATNHNHNNGRQQVVTQQRAILRLVGKETGLYPLNDHFQAAQIDEVMDAAEDIGSKTNAVGQGLSQPEKEAARLAACQPNGVTHQLVDKLDHFIAQNGTSGHVVGDTLTIADLFVYTTTSNLVGGIYDGVPANAVDGFAHISECRKLVRSHPVVKKWYDELQSPVFASFGPLE